MSLEAQIAQLDKTALEYVTSMCDPRLSNDAMRDYWLNVGQAWMFLIGLRKAQLVSQRRFDGMTLLA